MCLQTGIRIWSQGYAIGSGIEYGSPCFLLRTQSLNICFVFLTHTALHCARTTLRILSTASANCFVMASLTSSPCNAQLNQLDLVLRFILATKISFALLTDFFSQFWHLLQLYSAQVSRRESMPKWIGFQIFDKQVWQMPPPLAAVFRDASEGPEERTRRGTVWMNNPDFCVFF